MKKFLALALMVSCSHPTDPAAPPPSPSRPPTNVTGSWQGENQGFVIKLKLIQDSTEIGGGGRISFGDRTDTLHVKGSLVDKSILLRFALDAYLPIYYSGIVADTIMTGALNGSGFQEFPFVFVKQ